MRSATFKNGIILCLVAALVTLFWLYALERQREGAGLSERTKAAGAAEYEWKLVTSWPKNFPGLGTAPEEFARLVETMTEGRVRIKVFGGGELVPPLGVFDAVSQGSAQFGHAAAYYWKGKVPSSIFFTSVPFGLTAQEQNGWLHHGGGQELWEEAYEPFNLVPLAAGNTGVQGAVWFTKEIRSIEDIKGLKMRIPGVGGEVFNRAGGTSVTLPGSELYTSLQTGVIDATEWVGPYNDMALGFHEVADYFYFPGWQEPGPTLELTVNRDLWLSLPEDLQTIIRTAARAANQDMLDLYTARNNEAMRTLVEKHGVKFRRLPDDVLRELAKHSQEYLEELAERDPMAAKIYPQWRAFADGVKAYHQISERAYINARELDQP